MRHTVMRKNGWDIFAGLKQEINVLWVSGRRQKIWCSVTTVSGIFLSSSAEKRAYMRIIWYVCHFKPRGINMKQGIQSAALFIKALICGGCFQELRSVLVVEQYFHILKTIIVIRSPVAAQSSVYPQGDHLGIVGRKLSCKSVLHIFA